jgi:hypothetical protein
VLLRRLTGNGPLKQHGDSHLEAFAAAPQTISPKSGTAPAVLERVD